jgi:Tol biopolymer transport system component/predicted membrane protein
MNKIKHKISFNRIVLFSVILIANPVISFLLFKNLFIAISILLLHLIFSLFLYNSHKILYTYYFNLTVVISIFIHAELIFNIVYSDYIISDLYNLKKKYYFNKPNLKKDLVDKEYNTTYITNSQGFRISELHNPNDSIKNCDWLFIGDSYTQGAQVDYENLYTNKIQEIHNDKIILNAGISGFGINEEFNYYKTEGYKLNPNKVILQLCNFNDFMKVKEQEFGIADYLMNYSNFIRFILYDFKYENPDELPLGRWTEPFFKNKQHNVDYNIFYKETSEIKNQDLKKFKQTLSEFKNEVEKNDAELIIFLIPTKEQIHYKYFEEVIDNFEIDISKIDMKIPNDFLAKQCDSLGIKLIDLYIPFIESSQQLFFDYDEHLNNFGHQVLSKNISPILAELPKYKTSKISNNNLGDRYPMYIDSNFVSYQSYRDGNMELFVSLKNETFINNSRITYNDIDESHPFVFDNGEKILFTEGNQSTGKTNVIEMYIDGRSRKNLTPQSNIYSSIPFATSEGEKIYFAQWEVDSNNLFSNSYIVELSDGEKKIITSKERESWRPVYANGTLCYIQKNTDNKFDLFLCEMKNGIKRNISNSYFDEWDPSFSPDGKKIVYSANKYGNWDLFIYDIIEKKHLRLTSSNKDEWDPSFSPDGKKIIYAVESGLEKAIYELSLK